MQQPTSANCPYLEPLNKKKKKTKKREHVLDAIAHQLPGYHALGVLWNMECVMNTMYTYMYMFPVLK